MATPHNNRVHIRLPMDTTLTNMDPQTSSHLASIPQELTERIADFLPTIELSSLRLSCKALEHRLFNYFSKKFFSKKQFMVTEASLRALVDISEHSSLSPCLKHLIIGLDRYAPVNSWFSTVMDTAASTQYKLEDEAQKRLFATGRAVVLLSRALSNLKNLESVNIRDFNSRTRFRDADSGSGSWRSWGAPTLEARGHRLIMNDNGSDSNDLFPNRVFQAVLAALADSSSRPHSLVVILRNRAQGLADAAFGIDDWLEPSLAPVLANLNTLHLDLSLGELASLHTDQDLVDPSNTRVRHFLSLTPNLTWLRTNFKGVTKSQVYRFINWLATVPGSSPVLQPLPLPWLSNFPGDSLAKPSWGDVINPAPVALPLTQLDLGFGHVTARLLRGVLRKFPNLKGLSLFAMTVYPSPGQPFKARHDNLWAGLFRSMAISFPPGLKNLKIHDLRQADSSDGGSSVVVSVTPEGRCSTDVLVSGEELVRLASVTKVVWHEFESDAEDMGDDSDEIVEDEDDDYEDEEA